MKPFCCNPRIILNPLAAELITKFGDVTIRGEKFDIPCGLRNLYIFNKSMLSPTRLNISSDDLSGCYITDTIIGETYPLYLEVRCGKCDVCKLSKINAFVHRCELETQQYNYQPIFVTLTYNNDSLPSDGVVVRDVQLFMKRLRRNLEYKGYRDKLRYVCVGEYGKNTHRPHYHMIIWNLHITDYISFFDIRDLISECWQNGFVTSRLVDPSNNKSFYYTAKYLRKDCFIPDGCNSTFMCSSNRNGGIGANFIDGLFGHILKECDTNPKYVNKFSGQVHEVHLNKYILTRLFPTISTSIPAYVKTALRTLNVCYAQLLIERDENIHLFSVNYEKFNSFFKDYFFAPEVSGSDYHLMGSIVMRSTEKCLRDILEADIILSRWFDKGEEYYKLAKKKHDFRQVYLYEIFKNNVDVSDQFINHRAYCAQKSFAAAQNREIL